MHDNYRSYQYLKGWSISFQKLLFFGSFLLLSFAYTPSSKAQGSITIDHKTQRFVGDVSELDKSKFMNAHIWFGNNLDDPEFTNFKNRYDIDSEYKGSRRFWNPMYFVDNDEAGTIPPVADRFDGVRQVTNDVATGTASLLMHNEGVDYTVVDISQRSLDVAAYVAQSFKDQWNDVPRFYEPFNEPMIKAATFYPQAGNTAQSDIIITKMCEFHRDMGRAIHALPELANMQMVGYASAFPQFENNDFTLWNKRFKKFIDIAGEDVDVFSVHLYDGTGVNNSGGRRSGSNSEAIMDLIEAYSFERLNEVKPLAITEYGRLVVNQPGWPGAGVSNYEPVENAQAVRSQLHMVMSFIERGDDILYSVPFSTGKSNPYMDQYSRAGLWVQNDDGTFELTERRFFFEIWKDVKGKRVRINSTNIDVQTQAFVDGRQLYVMLNNLNDLTQSVNLDMVDVTGLQNVQIKRLKTFVNGVPALTTSTVTSAPASLNIDYAETIVLTYNFNSAINFTNSIFSKKYYATSTLKPITANQNLSYIINGVETGQGQATLRLGVGRDLGANLSPEVRINGSVVNYGGDVIRGYDQSTRSSFFGTLEIPVEMSLLNAGRNTVNVRFPDGGGHVSSAILQVQLLASPIATESISLVNFPASTEPADTYTFDVSYAAAQNSDIVVAIYENGAWVGAKTETVSAGVGTIPVTVNPASTPTSNTTYEVRAILRDVGRDHTTNRVTDIQPNLAIVVQTPFGGVARSIPGQVQAEDYDNGGRGISYFDNTVTNDGGNYRSNGVDIQPTGDGTGTYNVGWMSAGEWLEYTVNIASTQSYDFFFRVASQTGAGQYRVLLDGTELIGVQNVPNTGGWQTYATSRIQSVNLTAGLHVIRFEVVSNGMNLNFWAAWAGTSNARTTEVINEGESLHETHLSGIYPNPLSVSHEALTIVPDDLDTPYTLTITDMLGRVVVTNEQVIGSHNLSRSLFSETGIYIVRTFNGDISSFTKLIIE